MLRRGFGIILAGLSILSFLSADIGIASATTPDGNGARRVVTIGGGVTEILFALNLGDQVVAVDTSSTYPPEAISVLPNVGYIRALSPEGVLSVGPTLIIAEEGAGPPDALQVLKSAAIPVIMVPQARDKAGISRNIRQIAGIMGAEAAGEAMAQAVEADFDALEAMRGKITDPRRVTFVLSATGNAPVVGGRDTSADAIFRLAGVENAMHQVNGYKPAVDEAVLNADPYALILMVNNNHAIKDEAISAMPAFAGTQAIEAGRIFHIDGGYLLNFGPRTPQAARDLAARIYPELDLPPLPSHSWTAGKQQDGKVAPEANKAP